MGADEMRRGLFRIVAVLIFALLVWRCADHVWGLLQQRLGESAVQSIDRTSRQP
jgi:hypothetical protein